MSRLRIIFIVALLLSIIHVQAQATTDYGGCWVGIDGTINWYADSLNFSQNERLPRFLENYLMDWKLRKSLNQCTANENEMISYRYTILERVTNEKALIAIATSKNLLYDKIYDPVVLEKEIGKNYHDDFPTLPFMEYSFRALAQKRLEKIKKITTKINKP